jgi:hypothetical protein
MRLRHLRVVKHTAVLLAALSMVALLQPQAEAATPSWNYHLDIYYTSVTCVDHLQHVHKCPYPPPGTGLTNTQLAKELGGNFGRDFPISGGPNHYPNIGDRYDLRPALLNNAPVRVTTVGNISRNQMFWTFTALKGHFDGAGSTISFNFYSDGVRAHLLVDAHIIKDRSLFNAVNAGAARIAWERFYRNTASNVCRYQLKSKNCI